MADNIMFKIRGHEKFPLRDGWLNKGIRAVMDNNARIFLAPNGADVLGVGSNMVKAIRYWMQATGLLIKSGNREELSVFAQTIYANDPYFEDMFTIWLLHSNLAKNKEQATVWYMFFNNIMMEEFSKSDLQRQINVELYKYVGKQLTESSVKEDIDVLLNMYSKQSLKNMDPEDKTTSPLSELGLLKKDGDSYIKVQPDLRKLSDYVILYELSCMFVNQASISIDNIAMGEGSLGAIYNLSRVTVNRYLDNLEAMGAIRVDRTAGLDMVYPLNIGDPNTIIQAYYN